MHESKTVCEIARLPSLPRLRDGYLKLNGNWFIAPKAYFGAGTNGAAF